MQLAVLIVYSLGLLALGLWIGRRVESSGGFFVAGRALGPVLLFATVLAANIGAGSTVGAAGLGYDHGLSGWWWVGSAGIGTFFLAFWIGPRIWRLAREHELMTVGDYLEFRYDRTVRGIIAVLLWIGTLAILAGQLIALAWILEGWLPLHHLGKIPMQSLEEIAPEPSESFLKLAKMYPEPFAEAFGEPTTESFHDALRLARDVYIGEGCWHCHSQFVRPVSNEDIRFGPVATAAEFQNEMYLPQLFGTRRVGPDLSRSWNKHSIDWHVAHFYSPTDVVPTSVMPRYGWFFDDQDRPNAKGLAMITYVMWLGSWTQSWDVAAAETAQP